MKLLSTNEHFKKQVVFFTSLFLSFFYLIFILLQLEIPLDSSDGLTHYFVSNAAFKDHTLLLHHWGKPFYILVTTIFAQFGFKGIVFFNILVFFLTNFILYKCAQKLKLTLSLFYIFPLFTLFSYESTVGILSGMTEPLFNLVLVAIFYFLINKKWILLALFVGICPYIRSEGQLVVLLGLFILLKNKQWKASLTVFIPFIIYSIAGYFILQDFWWYFTQSPYSIGNDVYGIGNWSHYFNYSLTYLGYHGVLLIFFLIISVIIILVKKKWKILFEDHIVFGSITFLGIFFSHVYFWGMGINGSIGLIRLATQGLPLFLFVNLILIEKGIILLKIKNTKLLTRSLFILVFFCVCLNGRINFGKKELEINLIEACNFIKNKKINTKVYFQYPLVALLFDENLFLPSKKAIEYHENSISELVKNKLKYGDILIWDSHFGNQSNKISLDSIQNNSELVLIYKIKNNSTPEPIDQISLYQYIPKSLQRANYPKISFEQIQYKKTIFLQDEFYDIIKFEKEFTADEKLEFEIEYKSNDETFLCLDSDNGKVLFNSKLRKGTNTYIFQLSDLKKIKTYFWNKNKKTNSLNIKSIKISKTKYHPIYSKPKNIRNKENVH